MAERAFGITAEAEADQNTLQLANWILETRPERIVVRKLCRGAGPFVSGTKAEDIKAACMSLAGCNWLRAEFARRGSHAGRLQAAFCINPTLRKAS